MILRCKVCDKEYYIPYSTGIHFLFPVCSEKCLIEFIKNYDSTPLWSKEIRMKRMEDSAFRSFFEARIYKALSKHFKVLFEPYLLIHEDKMYLPDFYLPERGIFIETKGGGMSRYMKMSYFSKFVPLFLINKDFAEMMKWI